MITTLKGENMSIDIKMVLSLHLKWLRCEDSGKRANLRGANLHVANLREANLREADLYGADLRGADLRGANLIGAKDGAICRMDFGGWSICVRADKTSIGCQTHENKKWLDWSPDDVAKMHEDAREWWAIHGDVIKAAIRCVMSKGKSE